jgi:hypothetical protein
VSSLFGQLLFGCAFALKKICLRLSSVAWARCPDGIGKPPRGMPDGTGGDAVVELAVNHVNSHCSGSTLSLVQAKCVEREQTKI